MSARQLTLDASAFIIWRASRHMPPELGRLAGGLVATIGLFCGAFSPPATATVVIIAASVGACLAAAVGGTKAGRQVMRDIGEGLRRWAIARDRMVGK